MELDSRFRGNDDRKLVDARPSARMTKENQTDDSVHTPKVTWPSGLIGQDGFQAISHA
jgi:hypothetical protein